MKRSAMLAAAALFAATAAMSNDLEKSLEAASKAVSAAKGAVVKDIQVSSGFANGAATGAASAFPTSVKTVYLSYTSAMASVPLQAVWQQSKDGGASFAKIYTLNSTTPAAGTAAEFHLSRKSGAWPAGLYKVDLKAYGQTVGSASFAIDDAQSQSNSGVWGDDAAAAKSAQGETSADSSSVHAIKRGAEGAASKIGDFVNGAQKGIDIIFK